MELSHKASEPNPFFEPWYLLPALSAFDADDAVCFLVLEQDGQWLGLLPMARPSRYYGRPFPHLATWRHANCFLGAPLVAQGCETAFWRALLAWADSQGGTGLFLHLPQMPLDGVLAQALRAELRAQGRIHGVVQQEDRALLQSDLTAEAYLEASMSGKKRKELRRQFNRLAELGPVTFTRSDDADDLESWIADFLRLEMAGWKGKAGSALACAKETRSLFRESLIGAAAHKRLERITLSLNGAPIAMLVNFLTAPGAFSFKTAFDEAYSRFSPGVLLQRENLDLLEREGIAWCDSCASADHPMIDHIWRERRSVGALSIAIGGPLRRLAFRALLTAELGRRPDGART
ncbi:MAG: GNAT family N-acetyltransferase [Novosphingobium sp.]